jgi:hypothetical protein
MSFAHGKTSKVIVHNVDLSADLTQYQWGKSWQNPNVTTFVNNGFKSFLPGLADGKFNCQGIWNNALTDEQLTTLDGTRTIITASPLGISTIGDAAHMTRGYIENYQPRSPVNDAARFSSGVQSSAGNYFGHILHPLTARTSAANFDSVNGGAQTAFGGVAFLHVTAFSGTNATVTVQDSADDETFGTLKAFAQFTGTGSEAIDITGTVEQYVRVALSGTFTSVTFAVSFSRHRR